MLIYEGNILVDMKEFISKDGDDEIVKDLRESFYDILEYFPSLENSNIKVIRRPAYLPTQDYVMNTFVSPGNDRKYFIYVNDNRGWFKTPYRFEEKDSDERKKAMGSWLAHEFGHLKNYSDLSDLELLTYLPTYFTPYGWRKIETTAEAVTVFSGLGDKLYENIPRLEEHGYVHPENKFGRRVPRTPPDDLLKQIEFYEEIKDSGYEVEDINTRDASRLFPEKGIVLSLSTEDYDSKARERFIEAVDNYTQGCYELGKNNVTVKNGVYPKLTFQY